MRRMAGGNTIPVLIVLAVLLVLPRLATGLAGLTLD